MTEQIIKQWTNGVRLLRRDAQCWLVSQRGYAPLQFATKRAAETAAARCAARPTTFRSWEG